MFSSSYIVNMLLRAILWTELIIKCLFIIISKNVLGLNLL